VLCFWELAIELGLYSIVPICQGILLKTQALTGYIASNTVALVAGQQGSSSAIEQAAFATWVGEIK
jgi:hypothetical protein